MPVFGLRKRICPRSSQCALVPPRPQSCGMCPVPPHLAFFAAKTAKKHFATCWSKVAKWVLGGRRDCDNRFVCQKCSQNREKAFCHMLVEGGKMGFGGRRDCDNRFVCRKCLLFAAKTRTLCHPLLCLPARPFAGDDGAYAGASAG